MVVVSLSYELTRAVLYWEASFDILSDFKILFFTEMPKQSQYLNFYLLALTSVRV